MKITLFKIAGLLFLFSTILLISACSQKTDVEADREAIQKLNDEWASAIDAEDAKRAVLVLAEDCVEMHRPSGKISTGKDAVYERYSSAFQEFSIDFAMVVDEIVADRNLAYMQQTVPATWTVKANGDVLQEHSKIITILRRQPDESWKVARYIIWDIIWDGDKDTPS